MLLLVKQSYLKLAVALAEKGIMTENSLFFAVRLLEAININPALSILRIRIRLVSAFDEEL
jgi:hypothetical protein